jgi:hypothetical protein
MSKLLRSLTLIACCLVFSATAYADHLRIRFGENRDAFSLTVTGPAITRNTMETMMLGASWRVTFTITESINPGDAFTVRASARHVRAPHGEPASMFTFTITPGAFTPLPLSIGPFSFTVTATDQPAHVNHFDSYLARVRFFGVDQQINGYLFHLEGRHCLTTVQCPDLPREVEIPEPATLLLLGTGIAAVGIRLRKRFKVKNSQHCSREPSVLLTLD